MSQYLTGTATVTNNSPTVTGTNTLWLANVTAGDSFTVAGDGVMYDVASVDSDTQVTLSVPYAGTTASGAVYAIGTGFTVPDSFPEMSQGDIETATIFTRAMRTIQGKFNSLIDQAALANAQIFMSVAGGITGTSSGEFFFAVSGTSYTLYINDNGEEVEQVKFATFAEVYDLKVLAAASAEAASTSETNASDSADDSANSKSLADDARDITLGYRDETKAYRDDAVAVVTGGTATLEPEAGKIPLADAEGVIDSAWLGQYDPGIKQRREDLLKQATLSLDFANNKYEVYEGPVNSLTQMPFNTALDFTRGSTATARTATGKIQEVLTDEQRLVGNREGLLIEPQSTNLHEWSEDATKGFSRAGSGHYTISSNEIMAPDGLMTADKLTCINGGNRNVVYTFDRFDSLSVDSSRVHSIFIKKADSRYIRFAANTAASNNGSRQYGISFDFDNPDLSKAVKYSDGWFRLILARESTDYTTNDLSITIGSGTNSEVGDVFVWGWMTEVGSTTPTSYIPTAGTQVTRAADNCNRTLGDEYNASEGTIYCELTYPVGAGNHHTYGRNGGLICRILPASGASFTNQFVVYRYVGELYIAFRDASRSGFDQPNRSSGLSISEGVSTKIAVSWKAGVGFTFSVAGATSVSAFSDLPPFASDFVSLTTAYDGSEFSGIKKDFRILPVALSESELSALTGGN